MISIQLYGLLGYICYDNRNGTTVFLLDLQLLTDFRLDIRRNLAAFHIDDHIIFLFTIGFIRWNGYLAGITHIHAFDCFFEARNQFTFTKGELKRFTLLGCIKYSSVCDGSGIVYFNCVAFFYSSQCVFLLDS